MNVLLLGPQGSGKGTQAKRIQAEYGIPHIATGEILRDAIGAGTELGLRVKPIVESGKLVPDDLMIELIRERLGEDDAENGFILDGFPRTLPQAEALDAKMKELRREITAVILIDIPEEEVLRRLADRRTCEKNPSHIYHLEFDPPNKEGVCDLDGAKLIVRDDDKPEVIRNRLAQYREKTEPLIDYYEDRGILQRVEGELAPDEVEERIHALIGTLRREEEMEI
jgi:adenylate kinase